MLLLVICSAHSDRKRNCGCSDAGPPRGPCGPQPSLIHPSSSASLQFNAFNACVRAHSLRYPVTVTYDASANRIKVDVYNGMGVTLVVGVREKQGWGLGVLVRPGRWDGHAGCPPACASFVRTTTSIALPSCVHHDNT